MTVSSRTPEGDPFRCPVCGAVVKIESALQGDACCPHCNQLLWWFKDMLSRQRHTAPAAIGWDSKLWPESDSLDTVELVMELEEAFHVTIPDDVAERISNVADAVRFLCLQGEKQSD